MNHKLPGTYMLRELQDVTVPPTISWQPQTAGWLLLALSLAAYWRCSGSITEHSAGGNNVTAVKRRLPCALSTGLMPGPVWRCFT